VGGRRVLKQPERLLMLISSIYWNTSPELCRLGPVTIRWYGLLFALGFLLGYLIVQRIFRKEGIPENDLGTLLLYVLGGAMVGARLGHCFFYEPGYYLSRPGEIILIWRGGLASHGGAGGILIALYFYTRTRPGQSYLWLLDRLGGGGAPAGARGPGRSSAPPAASPGPSSSPGPGSLHFFPGTRQCFTRPPPTS